MRLIVKLVLPSIGALALASIVHPFGSVKVQRSATPLMAGAEATPEVVGILQRSCQNCHSERTEWPWYSYVAPMSWMIENDVHRARSHMNLSHWDAYPRDRQIELLTKMGVEVRNHRMPLPKYLQLHPQARLSSGDIQQLYNWARLERQRLRSAAEPKAKPSTD